MTYKAVINDTEMKPYKYIVDIYDIEGNFVEGTYVTEIEDRRKIKNQQTTI